MHIWGDLKRLREIRYVNHSSDIIHIILAMPIVTVVTSYYLAVVGLWVTAT